jgi:acetoin utilization protein AcuB
MTRIVAALSPEASVAEALALCRERRVRHIPILEEERLVGMVSDRDLRDASPAVGDPERSRALREIRVGEVMTREVITVDPQDSIENAAQQMYELKIGSLPVVDEGPEATEEELLGIITSSDALRALVMLAGLPEAGCRVEVRTPNSPGILAEVAGRIRDLGVDIVSVLADPDRRSGNRTMVFQLATADPSDILQSLKVAGYEATWISS